MAVPRRSHRPQTPKPDPFGCSADGHARMKAMIPTFDVDLASPAATADNARRSAQIDAVLQLHHPSSTN